ncbi:MAG: four helix bundle protein [Bacteroidetes bacterium]|nr:four helix bundle protein [Bacteroidota bacterium]
MFDFQKLSVYQKAKDFAKSTKTLLKSNKFDRTTNDQLKRASLSVMLNIAESSSRFSNKDRRNFLVIARGSAFECVAILEFLKENGEIDSITYNDCYSQLEEISKMLFGLIRKLEN